MSKTFDQLHEEYTRTVKALAVCDAELRDLEQSAKLAKIRSNILRSDAERLRKAVFEKLDADLTKSEVDNFRMC